MWLDAIVWWAALVFLGLAAEPFVERIFPPTFADRGHAFAKPIGLVAVGYFAWLLGSVGIAYHTALAGTLAATGVAATVARYRLSVETPRERRLEDEALFFGVLLAFALFRALEPAINGAEKYMDFAFFNTLLRTDRMPPEDPWMAGVPINYYYFGYLFFASLARITAIPAAVAYNLSLATIGAIAATTAASIGARLSGRRAGGWVAAVAFVGIGNLDAARQFVLERKTIASFDYWRSTRVVPHTINEFPFFSLLHGDLHPHVSALVIVVALIGVALAACDGARLAPRLTRENVARLALIALLLGTLSIANPWDVPVYLTLVGLCALECLWNDKHWVRAMSQIALVLAALAGTMVVLALPFTTRFHPQFQGIGRVHERTGLAPFVTVFGLLLFPPLVRLGRRALGELALEPAARDLAVVAAIFLGAVVYVATQSLVLFLCLAVVAAVLLEILDTAGGASRGALVLVGTAAVALGAAEIVFLRDSYGDEMHRMNTVFKLYFQAWVLLALAFGPLALEVGDSARRVARRIVRAVLVAGLAASFCYPIAVLVIRGRTLPDGLTLDGMAYLDREHRDDAAAIRWMAAHLTGLPVVIEATGDPYSYFARVSANTGLPTVLGWANHQGVWRGSDPQIRSRAEDVNRFYGSTDDGVRGRLLARYGIRYVFFGDLERERFTNAALERFHARPELFGTAYRSGGTEVLEVRQTTASE